MADNLAFGVDGWRFARATQDNIITLMSWFGDRQLVNAWGGPRFRYPFDRQTFAEDCHWPEMASFALHDPDGEFAAFGQVYNRNDRINLARLVAHPEKRGQGVGKRLVQGLMQAGAELFDLQEYSLFVYRDNTAALECYRSQGFTIQDFPQDELLADVCYYLTRPVSDEQQQEGRIQ